MNEIEFKEYINLYSKVSYYKDETGYIVWRYGTGENVELLNIHVYSERGTGNGLNLVNQMLRELSVKPPYHTVFGFTRVCNTSAIKFYEALGFIVQRVEGVYQDGEAILFTQSYKVLVKLLDR